MTETDALPLRPYLAATIDLVPPRPGRGAGESTYPLVEGRTLMTHTATVPADLIALELTHRAAKTMHKADIAARRPACGYAAYLAGHAVAKHPWLTQHPGTSPERRAARKALRLAADAVSES